ncbi:MAG: CHRD domain-containing protein [Verrucomicrobiota bacterium]|nr:CHRD domain-containing protein [Verrucomicrobiota bacterium]
MKTSSLTLPLSLIRLLPSRIAVSGIASVFPLLPLSAATVFDILLEGSQEVPPVSSPATGSGTASLVDLGSAGLRLEYSITFSADLDFSGVANIPSNGGNIQVMNFHIHNQVRGLNGGVIYGIFGPDQDFDNDVVTVLNANNTTTITGSWGPADGNPVGNINTFAPLLLAAAPGEDTPFYFNIHTPAFPAGEIRGQIVAVPEPATIGFLGLCASSLLLRRRRVA